MMSDGFMEKEKNLANQYAEEKRCTLSFDLKDQVKRNAWKRKEENSRWQV